MASARYCETTEPESLVQCLACYKYFCNSRAVTISSHIVHHIYRSKHRLIKLARPSRSNPSICYLTGCVTCAKSGGPRVHDTIFTLGVTSLGVQCKPCADASRRRWAPLIKHHALVKSVMPSTPKDVTVRGRKRDLDIQTIVEQDVEQRSVCKGGKWRDQPKSLLLRYDTPKEYYCILFPWQEREAARSRRSTQTLSGEITIQRRDAEKIIFSMPSARGAGGGRLCVGDPVHFTLATDPADSAWDYFFKESGKLVGLVEKIDLNGSLPVVRARIVHRDKAPGVELPVTNVSSDSSTAVIHVNWNDSAHKRKKMALKRFALEGPCMDNELRKFILGNISRGRNSKVPSVPNPTDEYILETDGAPIILDATQREAVDWAMNQTVAIIQGPPGTGKTRTLTALVCRLLTVEAPEKLLVCAPSNAAVDHLEASFKEAGLDVAKVVRLPAFPTPEDFDDTTLRRARVICATCIGSDSRLLEAIDHFPIVLIDEATQATEAETLVPLLKGCRKLVLVGDHKQLGPVVVDNRARAADLGCSMFERFVNLGAPRRRLQVQYRMHPSIWAAPGERFYEDPIRSSAGAEASFRHDVDFPWPRAGHPVLFLDVQGAEERSGDDQSWINRQEAAKTVDCVARLVAGGVEPHDIAVISFYSGQVDYVRDLLKRDPRRRAPGKIRVSTVDSFQGQEKPFVLVSCVRGDSGRGIGFLSEEARVNVAITRAKCGSIIVGNAPRLEGHSPWKDLIPTWRGQRYVRDESWI
jgi:regulator of nonsense transcripts 1